MSMADLHACGARPRGSGRAATLGVAEGLALAAAPTFAIMAVLTALDATPDALCGAMHASPLSGMAPMYWLMAAFHVAPWLKLVARQRA